MKTYPFKTRDFFDYETERIMKGLETELNQLREDIGKCHDAIGESRESDTSELYKFFEHDIGIIERVRAAENALDEFNHYKRAMHLYIGSSRVMDALANYESTPR